MPEGNLLLLTPSGFEDTISVKKQLLHSLRDVEYRRAFVSERVRSSIALQIRALRKQRGDMTQAQLGEKLGMAQTWVSNLENPEYGKMTVATLLRLADAFDVDLEIKFRSFSAAVNTLSMQGADYFWVPSFADEYERKLSTGAKRIYAQTELAQPVGKALGFSTIPLTGVREISQLPSPVGATPLGQEISEALVPHETIRQQTPALSA